jgi:hypothetical protein
VYPTVKNSIGLDNGMVTIRLGSEVTNIPLFKITTRQDDPQSSFKLGLSTTERIQRQATVLPYTTTQIIEYQSDSDPDEDLLF